MSADFSRPTIPPPPRDKSPYLWTADELMTFVETNVSRRPKDLEQFRALDVDGQGFLTISVDWLEQHKISPGAALCFQHLARSLQAPAAPAPATNKRTGGLLEKLSNKAKATKTKLQIVVDNLNMLTATDLENNSITYKTDPHDDSIFLTSSSSDWPKYVQDYHDILIAKPKYPVDPQDPNILAFTGVLKQSLGSDVFAEQFKAGTSGMTAGRLLTYVTAVDRVQRGLSYHEGYGAVAKEVNLTGLVVDPAIVDLKDAYYRDKSRTVILIADQEQPWCPRSDFSVGYGSGDNTWLLFHGETDSGEEEWEAMHKNALISCHSWKLFNHLTKETRHIILSAYISKQICTMHMFYKSEEGFVMEPILRIPDMFDTAHYVVEFLSRMHQFAANIQWHSNFKGLQKDPDIRMLYAKTNPRSVKSRTTKSTSAARTTPKSSGKGDPSDKIQDADLDDTGFEYHEMLKHDHIAVVRDLGSGGKCIAKKVWDKQERQIINFLLTAKSAKYANHTIILKAEFILENDRALLVMPQYVDLSTLARLDQSTYYDLRSQLIEGVAFMHEQGVAHRDLKPSNLVVESRNKPRGMLFIIDYGLAKQYAAGELCAGYRGTKDWTAPEVQDEAEWYPMPADVWSMAQVIVWLAKLARCNYSDMELALSTNPSSRPTAAELHIQVSPTLPVKPPCAPVAVEGYHGPF